jgi:hypothetical protein
MVANQRVHDRVVEAMAHMQTAGDIGRRDRDAIRIATARGGEAALLLPVLIGALLDILRIVSFIHGILCVGGVG